jgi:hypothetical protein
MTQREYRESILDLPPQERAEYEYGKEIGKSMPDEEIERLTTPIGRGAGDHGLSPLLKGIARAKELRDTDQGKRR